jgi:heme A synthase
VTPIQFYAIFIPAVVLFALLIWVVGRKLYEKVQPRTFLIGVLILIGGIIGGVVMMFQPFVLEGFKIGFGFVFVSLFAFMVWSHVQPRTRRAAPATTAEGPALEIGAPGEPAVER